MKKRICDVLCEFDQDGQSWHVDIIDRRYPRARIVTNALNRVQAEYEAAAAIKDLLYEAIAKLNKE
jgi:hypothetical protein